MMMMTTSFSLCSSPSPLPHTARSASASLCRVFYFRRPLTAAAAALSSPVAFHRRGNRRDSRNKKRRPYKNFKKEEINAKDVVVRALYGHIDKEQWLQALKVFEMLKEQPFYQLKECTYMKLLLLLGKCGQARQAQQLFDSMIEEGLEPNQQLYTALVGAYCRSNLIDKALTTLHQMIELPHCQPDVYTYSILIKACVDASQFDLVESLYEQMAERSIVPNTVTQNIVLSGYGRAGKYEEMEKVLARMLESPSCKPDACTMNTFLSLYGKKGEIEMMERWYEKFCNLGVKPESRTFNILIGAYGKKRMYDKMSLEMKQMRKHLLPRTTSTFNHIIEMFSDAGDVRSMDYTLGQMRADGLKPNTRTFCCLIRGYANAGLFPRVINTVQLAGQLEIPENTYFYNSVIYACAKAEDFREMERVFKRMKDKQCLPDDTTYSVMVDAYRKQGMTDKVYDLEQEKQMMCASESNESHSDDEKLDLAPA